MSIWSSIGGVDELERIPWRCEYCAAETEHQCGQRVVTPDWDGTQALPASIDVATAASWHGLIRLSVSDPLDADELLITVAEAETLIEWLRTAVERIKREERTK